MQAQNTYEIRFAASIGNFSFFFFAFITLSHAKVHHAVHILRVLCLRNFVCVFEIIFSPEIYGNHWDLHLLHKIIQIIYRVRFYRKIMILFLRNKKK